MKALLSTALLVPALLLGGETAAAAPLSTTPGDSSKVATWEIDPVHSELTFQIRHLIGRVSGSFNEWGGVLTADPQDLASGAVNVTIQTASINTENQKRDGHLRSADFFDAENHPTITFKSRSVQVKGSDIDVAGDLTIRGVTKPVVLSGTLLGVAPDPWGNQRIAFEAETEINRKDFGVSWNEVLDAGGTMLGEDVKISIVLQAVRK